MASDEFNKAMEEYNAARGIDFERRWYSLDEEKQTARLDEFYESLRSNERGERTAVTLAAEDSHTRITLEVIVTSMKSLKFPDEDASEKQGGVRYSELTTWVGTGIVPNRWDDASPGREIRFHLDYYVSPGDGFDLPAGLILGGSLQFLDDLS